MLLGDCGMARLNKDGLGSAYRVGKVAAATALFSGVSADDFGQGVLAPVQVDRGRQLFRKAHIQCCRHQ